MAKYIALLRGINVGSAKGIAMADLRSAFEELGYTNVETVLRSGNVVFESAGTLKASAGTLIEDAVLMRTGVQSSVLIFDADTFRRVVAENPLTESSDDDSRLLVTFLDRDLDDDQVDAAGVSRPGESVLAPEELAIGSRAVYQWCPDGVLHSKVPRRFWKQFPHNATARNWRTVTKLLARLDA
ncbi:DUF1697 domain-containing protein [Planctomonas psychrotolerans]|uniref:DUF1697 domain-containing protein n=1 Tax=Planctomonas psychrotolerans TaxID=2528712 RepID=UPI001D0D3C8F|nr:DUF1697 domain-containing protein [Planctomonas psychrotolerans]